MNVPGFAGGLVAVALLGGAALIVDRVQPALARGLHASKLHEDVYVLPPPGQLKVMALGYDAATVDLLWAKMLVEYGTHHHEKREFPDLEKYVEAMLALEPNYAPVYQYADTLFVYRPPRGYEQDARTARNILERGTKARPYDSEVWRRYGEFLAFVAPSFLSSDSEIATWRREGADALGRAVDLGADATRAVTAAALLSKSGERTAAIRQLRSAYALTDDPDERERIAAKLQGLEASEEREAVQRHYKVVESQWKAALPGVPRGEFLVLGPVVDPAKCVGPASEDAWECARHWSDLFARLTPSR